MAGGLLEVSLLGGRNDPPPRKLCVVIGRMTSRRATSEYAPTPSFFYFFLQVAVDIGANQVGDIATVALLEETDQLLGKNHLLKRSLLLIKVNAPQGRRESWQCLGSGVGWNRMKCGVVGVGWDIELI